MTAENVWIGIVVPSGRRAVIRTVDPMNATGLDCYWMLEVAGYARLYRAYPASEPGETTDTRIVAYAGEVIRGYCSHAGLYLTVCGYLFDDPYGRQLADDGQADHDAPAPDYPALAGGG